MQLTSETLGAPVLEIPISDIHTLDFSMVKLKLQDPDEGQGWTPELCDQVEREYKNFLALKRVYSDRDIVPNHLVDLFWHQHILDTAKYAEDCQLIFGFFLHHFPYFGMRGEEDFANLCNAFEETKALNDLHFDAMPDQPPSRKAKCRSACRTGCKPVKCK
jgi:hypothetical protein